MDVKDNHERLPVLIDHLSADLITTHEEFEKLNSEWTQLFNSCTNPVIFQSYVWNYVWWKYYGQSFQLAIVVVREKDKVVGIGPFMMKKRLGVPEIEPIGGSNQGAYFGLLSEDDSRDDIAEIIAAKLATSFPEGIIHIPYYAAGNVSMDVFLSSLIAMGWAERRWVRNISHYVYQREGFNGFLSVKSRSARHNLKYERKRLENAGKMSIARFQGYDINETIVERIAAIQRKSWLYRRGQILLNGSYYKELIPALAGTNSAEIFLLSLDEEDVAFVMNFCSGKDNYCEFIGFDEKYKNLSPGKVLMADCVRQILDRGDVVLDFLFGDGDYKKFWGNRTRRILRSVTYKGFQGWLLSWFPHRLHGSLSQYNMLRHLLGRIRRLARSRVSVQTDANNSNNGNN